MHLRPKHASFGSTTITVSGAGSPVLMPSITSSEESATVPTTQVPSITSDATSEMPDSTHSKVVAHFYGKPVLSSIEKATYQPRVMYYF